MSSIQSEKGLNEILQRISRLIRSIEFGEIEIVIHHSNVVQINKIEKIRLDKDQPTYCI